MSATVVWVEKKGDTAGIMVMSDETKVWTPDKAKADALVGKEIPSDWTIKDGQYGPQAFPPRVARGGGGGGFAAAFRNTKEGQAVEQERMDRRTALMQAVTLASADGALVVDGVKVKALATEMYAWLRETSGADHSTASGNGEVKAPEPRLEAQASPTTSGEVGPEGEAGPTSSAAHEHNWVPSPKLKSFDICTIPTCYETRKRAVVDV